jgi:hypothetical protein
VVGPPGQREAERHETSSRLPSANHQSIVTVLVSVVLGICQSFIAALTKRLFLLLVAVAQLGPDIASSLYVPLSFRRRRLLLSLKIAHCVGT